MLLLTLVTHSTSYLWLDYFPLGLLLSIFFLLAQQLIEDDLFDLDLGKLR